MPITTLDDGSAGLEFLVKTTIGFAKGLFLGYLTSSFLVNNYHLGSYNLSNDKNGDIAKNMLLNGGAATIATDVLEFLVDSSIDFGDDFGTMLGGSLGYYVVYKHRERLYSEKDK